MSINLHIERLVLEGVELGPGQERPLRAALEGELARLLGAGGLAPELRGGGAVPRAGAGALGPGAAGEGPAALGRRIARAVYAGIGANDDTQERAHQRPANP